jgi:CBS domain-containing protein
MRGLCVQDIMTRDVYAVGPDTDLGTVTALFSLRHISGVPVVDDAGRPLGIVTKTDLLAPGTRRRTQGGKPIYYRLRDGMIHTLGSPRDEHVGQDGVVGDVMSAYLFTVSPKSPLVDAMRLMTGDEIHRVVVVDNGRIVGMVTTMDLLRAALRWVDGQTSGQAGEPGESD